VVRGDADGVHVRRVKHDHVRVRPRRDKAYKSGAIGSQKSGVRHIRRSNQA
jgi:hypothetical protein